MHKSELSVLRNDGSQGVSNLARVCEAIGYQGSQFRSSITEFLEDNPAAVEALFSFIEEYNDDLPEPLEEEVEEWEADEEADEEADQQGEW